MTWDPSAAPAPAGSSPAPAPAPTTDPVIVSAIDQINSKTITPIGGRLPVMGPLTDVQLRATPVPVSVEGVATAANQTTANQALAEIDAKIPPLLNGSVPVVAAGAATADAQSAANAYLASIDGKTIPPFHGMLPVVGPMTYSDFISAPVSVTVAGLGVAGGKLPVVGPVTNAELRAAPIAVTIDGGASSAAQTTANASLASIDGKTPALVGNAVPVTGPLTDAQMRATAVPVSMSGAATGAAQATGNQSLSNLDGKLPAKGAAVAAAAMPVTIATDDPAVGAKVTSVAALGAGGSGLIGWLSVIWAGVTASIPAGTNSIGKISDITNPVQVLPKPATSGGLLVSKVLATATTNAAVIKSSAGQVYGVHVSNSGLGWAFLRLFNKASLPVMGTDSPVEVIAIPPGGRADVSRPMGTAFSNGIAVAITGSYIDLDVTAIALGQVVGSIHYA